MDGIVTLYVCVCVCVHTYTKSHVAYMQDVVVGVIMERMTGGRRVQVSGHFS